MITTLLQFALSISVLCNLFTIWQLCKCMCSQSNHLDELATLVMDIADANVKEKYSNMVVLGQQLHTSKQKLI